MKVAMRPFILAVALASLMAGCRKRHGSLASPRSLTAQEMQNCRFDGRRFLIVVAPDFVGDVNLLQNLLVKYHSDAQLFQRSAIRANPALASNPDCRRYYESEASKYEEFAVIQGPNATFANMRDKLAALKRRIINEYRNPLKREGKEQGAVQVVIAFTGHGSNNEITYPDGSLVFAGAGGGGPNHVNGPGAPALSIPNNTSTDAVRMRDVLQAIYDNLFSKCGINCNDPDEQIADEIVTLIDSCYSGIFGEAARSLLAEKAYDLQISKDSTSKATRFFSMSAADRGQTAAGALRPTGRGTLYQMLSEVIEYFTADLEPIGNKDGKVAFAELWKYVQGTAYMRFIGPATEMWEGFAKQAICESSENRRRFKEGATASRQFLQRAFQDPINGIYDDTNGIGQIGSVMLTVQRPTMFSNMSADLLDETIFALRDPASPANAQAQQVVDAHTDKSRQDEAAGKLKTIIHLVEALTKYFEGKTDLTGRIQFSDLQVATDQQAAVQAAFERLLAACPPSGSEPNQGGGAPMPTPTPPDEP